MIVWTPKGDDLSDGTISALPTNRLQNCWEIRMNIIIMKKIDYVLHKREVIIIKLYI